MNKSIGKNISITIGLCVYNKETYIKKCINSILNSIAETDEVVIVEDGSTDNSKSYIKEFLLDNRINIIDNKTNYGLAFSRNIILKESKNNIIYFIDADVIITKENISIVKDFFIKNSDYAALGGGADETEIISLADRWRSSFMRQSLGDNILETPEFLPGLNLAVNKEYINKLGGFNEKLRTNAEDVDLCIRMRMQGYKYLYLPELKAKHIRQDTVKTLFNTVYNHIYWVLQVYKLHNKNYICKYFLAGFKVIIKQLFFCFKNFEFKLIFVTVLMFIAREYAVFSVTIGKDKL